MTLKIDKYFGRAFLSLILAFFAMNLKTGAGIGSAELIFAMIGFIYFAFLKKNPAKELMIATYGALLIVLLLNLPN